MPAVNAHLSRSLRAGLFVLCAWGVGSTGREVRAADPPRTEVSIRGEQFFINGRPTYAGRTWQDHKIEGLLFNSRMACGIFDDANPSTAKRWAYADTGRWDAERNTNEFIAAMPEWRRHGLLAFTLCLQGGCPRGYWGKNQPWNNAAFDPDGTLQAAYRDRAERILDQADALGMVVILGIYYFGQDERLRDEQAVTRGVDEVVEWLLQRDYRHVLIEIANECDSSKYDHAILRAPRVSELLQRVRERRHGDRRLLAGVSFKGGVVPKAEVARHSDFLLLHGNGQSPDGIKRQIRKTRALLDDRLLPLLYNEDDHYDFDQERNNMQSAIDGYCSWGLFDHRQRNEPREYGYQDLPVDWSISSPRKRAFFNRLAEITGSPVMP